MMPGVGAIAITPVNKKLTDSMSDYVIYFERLALANEWDDKTQARVFPSLLEVGSKALDGFSDATLASFAAVKKALLGDTEPFRESNCAKLMNISRMAKETLPAYRERIAGLVEKVYPKFAANNRQLLIRDYFVHSLPQEYQKFLWTTNSAKIEDALNAALLFESTTTVTQGTGNAKPSHKGAQVASHKTEREESGGKKTKTSTVCFFLQASRAPST